MDLCEKANRKCCECYIKRANGKIENIGALDDVLEGGGGGDYVEDGGER